MNHLIGDLLYLLPPAAITGIWLYRERQWRFELSVRKHQIEQLQADISSLLSHYVTGAGEQLGLVVVEGWRLPIQAISFDHGAIIVNFVVPDGVTGLQTYTVMAPDGTLIGQGMLDFTGAAGDATGIEWHLHSFDSMQPITKEDEAQLQNGLLDLHRDLQDRA